MCSLINVKLWSSVTSTVRLKPWEMNVIKIFYYQFLIWLQSPMLLLLLLLSMNVFRKSFFIFGSIFERCVCVCLLLLSFLYITNHGHHHHHHRHQHLRLISSRKFDDDDDETRCQLTRAMCVCEWTLDAVPKRAVHH